jgi:Tol biopolymer transport system component
VKARRWLQGSLLTGTIITLLAVAWFARNSGPATQGVSVAEHFADATLSVVTDYPGSHTEPTLSPNGRMLAYVSDASGTPQIWVRNLQRGDPVQITDGMHAATSPTWSPNDEQILFIRTAPSGPRSIHSVGTLGKPAPSAIIEYATHVRFAARVDSFVFSRGMQIWRAENDGRDQEQVLGVPKSQGFAPRTPALSPDGDMIAFIHANEGPFGNLWVIPSAGGEARRLTDPETSGGYARAPVWTPDGRSIVYSVNADTGAGHLWRVNVNNGEAAPLTTGPGGADKATVSADGSRLAYTTTRATWRLTRVDPLTGELSAIYESRQPIFLPAVSGDGHSIAFFSKLPSGMQLFVINKDGADLRQITFDEAGENALPSWAGDGENILYYRGRSLHRLSPIGGLDTQIYDDFHWSSRNWLSAYEDQITFHNIDRTTGEQHTFVRTIDESTEIELPIPIESAQWSPDGSYLAGWFRQTGEVLLCRADGSSCRNLESDGKPIRGTRPVWSKDGSQIYYLRSLDPGVCCALWRVGLDGEGKQKIAELENFDFANSTYGIDANGAIVYNSLDQSSEEIWLAVLESQ